MNWNQKGFSLLETIVAGGLSAGLVAGGVTVFLSLQKQGNNFEFESKKEELRRLIITQVLDKPINCKCLFANASTFSYTGTDKLISTPPDKIGRFMFPSSPPDCAAASLPGPFVTKEGMNGLRLEAIELKDIKLATKSYVGSLQVFVSTTTKVSGTGLKAFRIPVGVHVSGSSMKTFEGCSMKLQEDISNPPPSIYTWNSSGGSANRTFPNTFSFCVLSYVNTGGEEGAGSDHCKVIHEGGGLWQVNGSRNGGDGRISCSMTCQ